MIISLSNPLYRYNPMLRGEKKRSCDVVSSTIIQLGEGLFYQITMTLSFPSTVQNLQFFNLLIFEMQLRNFWWPFQNPASYLG